MHGPSLHIPTKLKCDAYSYQTLTVPLGVHVPHFGKLCARQLLFLIFSIVLGAFSEILNDNLIFGFELIDSTMRAHEIDRWIPRGVSFLRPRHRLLAVVPLSRLRRNRSIRV
ncbi:hypothetical protein TNCV_1350421 [Trichonephila clavipes]|nr:hypothetical protein TNCV_1350421 [Trichonephila clavipes]